MEHIKIYFRLHILKLWGVTQIYYTLLFSASLGEYINNECGLRWIYLLLEASTIIVEKWKKTKEKQTKKLTLKVTLKFQFASRTNSRSFFHWKTSLLKISWETKTIIITTIIIQSVAKSLKHYTWWNTHRVIQTLDLLYRHTIVRYLTNSSHTYDVWSIINFRFTHTYHPPKFTIETLAIRHIM